ncbi:endolytic peptidoglycan transglycosylase RlpA [Entomohabitans teleogrylli]|uniref:endolytic peptidoglycan transglycosylase RlpA n=1 Tax=Entomohabitans teleogrylli TaxID=1384589 RepID=UPI00073DAC8F|nr:endolytic peptidoglycan transglycosylase RlpA [Entomohabitans teleogrylli]
MRKQWTGICIAAALLAGCTSDDGGQQNVSLPQPAVCNGPVVEISGVEPRYEPLNPSVNQDYKRDGTGYRIVQDPANFTQSGLAAIYDAEPGSNLTASGEAFDPLQLTAAHPTLPIPSYARITNLANGRMLVVRINDRGPYGNGRVISLSRAAADRLNTSNNTRVRIDPIIVAPDGSLSGPGMACTTIARQTYVLPSRPDLSGGLGSASSAPQPVTSQGDVRAISNTSLKSEDTIGAPVNSSGFLGAPTTLPAGVIENDAQPATDVQPATAASTPAAPQAPVTVSGTEGAPVTAPNSIQGSVNPGYSQLVVQVGAVSDSGRASQLQQSLSQRLGVPGLVSHNGTVYRIQLGPFASKAQAITVQQRLLNEVQMQSFITTAPVQ